MKGKLKYYIYFLAAFILIQCKERFEPNLPVVPQGYLVVEGFINAKGPTEIRLSRTVSLDQKKVFKAEPNAVIKVESDDNLSFTLKSLSNGVYRSDSLSLNTARKYRINIKTSTGKAFFSDFTPVKITPAMDSINWKQGNGAVTIYANTHDPQSNSIYYMWDFIETWEIHSLFQTSIIFDNGIVRNRIPTDPEMYTCYKYDTSHLILLASSKRLEKDVIYQYPLISLQRGEERLGVRYSVKVSQYALTKECFGFMEQMKKNTESLGTIFDPQPTFLKGNIHAVVDSTEPVIGYMFATTRQEKRIFISSLELGGFGYELPDCDHVLQGSGTSCCRHDTIPSNKVSIYYPAYLPFSAIYTPPIPTPTSYVLSSAACVDCRLRGSNIKPSFW